MGRNSTGIVNRFPPDLVFLVAEKLEQVLNDIGANTKLAAGEITPAVLTERKGRLRTASIVVTDAESKLKGYRDSRNDEADDTYEALVRLHDAGRGVYGANSIEYKRIKAVYDELRKRHTRGKGNGNSTTGSSSDSTPSTDKPA